MHHADTARRLILVDGSSYLYRAFHALPPLRTRQGQPTGAIKGVIAMLRSLRASDPAALMAVIFDAKGKNFRHSLYPDYKAQRPPMPDELVAQIAPLQEIIDAMGLLRLAVPEVEADDVIATLTTQALQRGLEVLISTGDKDLAQLVGPRVSLLNTMSDERLDEAGVWQKFGVSPAQIVDYLSLIGDKADNIPGVPKVGPKMASKWLAEYGSLQGIIDHVTAIGGKVGENLRATLPQLPLYQSLIRVKTDLPLDIDWTRLEPGAADQPRLRELFTALEFKGWLQALQQEDHAADTAHNAAQPRPRSTRDAPSATAVQDLFGAEPGAHHGHYVTITDAATLHAWLDKLAQAPLWALDVETSDLDPMRAELVGLSFAVTAGEAAYLPLAHRSLEGVTQLPREATLERLRPLLEDPQYAKLGHHLKYDAQVLANHGITLAGITHDSLLQSYLLDSQAHRHSLDALSEQHLQYRTLHYEEVTGKGARQIPFAEVPLEQATRYAAEDADICLRLHQHLWPQLCTQAGPRRVYEQLEIPLIPVLARMERHGVYVDKAHLQTQSRALAKQLTALEQQAFALAGEPFNLASPKQIQQILFDKHGLPAKHKTPKGQPSTAEEALEALAEDYPLPAVLLAHRRLAKLKSTYTDKLPGFIHPRTGRIHASYQQAVTSTGRLSCSDPNLQNIPIRTPPGRLIRQAFTAPPGRLLLAADYSQIELRIMAHLSQDSGLLAAFAAGEDIHRATAAEIFNRPLEQVSAEERRAAKAINFGLIYGMSAFGLARELKLEQSAAKDYMARYFARYPGVQAYMQASREQALSQGYVETLLGRRLYLPDIRSRNAQRRAQAERLAINAPMQGSAADIIKAAMLKVDAWLQHSGFPAMMIMQVHDELVFEVQAEQAQALGTAVSRLMSEALTLHVPLLVDIGIGDNWDAAH